MSNLVPKQEEEKKDIDSPSNDVNLDNFKSNALTKTQPSYGHTGVQEKNKIKNDPKRRVQLRKYYFEDLDPLKKFIFCPNSKSLRAESGLR